MGFGEQGKMAFISGGTAKFEGTEEQANLFQRNKETCTPPERASHVTLATEYNKSNGIQYDSEFAIVIQAMKFKQMLSYLW